MQSLEAAQIVDVCDPHDSVDALFNAASLHSIDQNGCFASKLINIKQTSTRCAEAQLSNLKLLLLFDTK
jgi:hypothetical protein